MVSAVERKTNFRDRASYCSDSRILGHMTDMNGQRVDKSNNPKERQDKTRATKETIQEEMRKQKRRQDKTIRYKKRKDKKRQYNTIQDKTKQDKIRQNKIR